MDFTSIQIFSTIVETGNLSKTAELLYMSQSTVSHHLKLLEKELDTKLIVRKKGHKTIRLTPAGADFILIAKKWIALWNETKSLGSKEYHSSLNIGCTDSINTYIFPGIYQEILEKEPLINLHVKTHHSLEIHNLLLSHELDIGFVVTLFATNNLISEPVYQDEMVLICDQHCELKDSVHPKELDPGKEISVDWGSDFKNWHDYWFASEARPRIEFNNPSLVLTMMGNTDYWSIVPLSMAKELKKSCPIVIKTLQDGPSDRLVYKLTHRYPLENRVENIKKFETYLGKLKAVT